MNNSGEVMVNVGHIEGQTRKFMKISEKGPEQVSIDDIEIGDRFMVIDGEEMLSHENGSMEFVALSKAHTEYGMKLINIDTSW